MTKEELGQLILSSERQLYATAKTILADDQDCADAIQESIILYHGSLITMKHENGSYRLYLPSEEPGDDYDYYMEDGVAKIGSMTYYSAVEDYGNGGNYIGALAPGESVQVVMAWIVDETDLDNMYLNLNSDGGIIEFTDSMLKGGVISLSAHK